MGHTPGQHAPPGEGQHGQHDPRAQVKGSQLPALDQGKEGQAAEDKEQGKQEEREFEQRRVASCELRVAYCVFRVASCVLRVPLLAPGL